MGAASAIHGNVTQHIHNSYATGNVSGYGFVGGLVGFAGIISTTLINVYTTGNVNGSTFFVGSVTGANETITFTNIYWNNHSGNPSNCYPGGNTGCIAMDNNESYFFDVSNPPMANWSYPPWDDVCQHRKHWNTHL